jgi:SAM-dependent methyltransferase
MAHNHDQHQEHSQGHDQAHAQGHQQGHGAHDASGMFELLDLDGIVLHRYLEEVTSWVAQWAPTPVRRIVDLGTGTGMGSFALARRFEQASITAVDGSPDSLAHLTESAARHGLAGRVSALHVDLDEAFPPIDEVDVIWSSLAMHHFGDPTSIARQVGAALAEDGIFAVVEMTDSPSFLPSDLGFGTPGLESRCHAVLAAERAEALPYLGADWRTLLEQAGLTIVAEREFTVDPARPYPGEANRYARAYLQLIRDRLSDRLAAEDLATLNSLLEEADPQSILRRTDLDIHGTRQAWIARRG